MVAHHRLGINLVSWIRGITLLVKRVLKEMPMQPLRVRGVVAVFYSLEPVVRSNDETDLSDQMIVDEIVPPRQQWRGFGAEVSKDHSTQRLHRVAFQLHFLFQFTICGFTGLSNTLPFGIVGPSVIGTPQTVFHRIPGSQVDSSMRANVIDQSNLATQILVKHQVFAEQPDWNDLLRLQIRAPGDRVPIAPHKLATGRAGPYPGECFVFSGADHCYPPVLLLTSCSCSAFSCAI